jgi:hypothetical protein
MLLDAQTPAFRGLRQRSDFRAAEGACMAAVDCAYEVARPEVTCRGLGSEGHVVNLPTTGGVLSDDQTERRFAACSRLVLG